MRVKEIARRGPRRMQVATTAMCVEEDRSKTLEKMESIIAKTKMEYPGLNLVQFGEAITGWYIPRRMIERAEPIPGPSSLRLAEAARRNGVFVSFGLPERRDGKCFNSQVLIDDQGEIRAVHRKWNLKKAEKEAGFSQGPDMVTRTEILGFKTGMLICADASHPEVMREARKERFDLLLFSLADDEDPDWLVARLMAKLYRSWIISANRFGAEACFWNGHLVISDPEGRIVQKSVMRESVLRQTIEARGRSTLGNAFLELRKLSGLAMLAARNIKAIRNLLS